MTWAGRHEQEVNPILASGVSDWAAVATFYSAMHFIEAYFKDRGIPEFKNHGARNRFVALDSNLRPVAGAYQRLYDTSWACRYRGLTPKASFVSSTLVGHDLPAIKQQILRLVSSS